MNAYLLFDSDQPAYCNLDEISGKVVLRCAKSISVNSILVKLEGESRTRLMSPVGAHPRIMAPVGGPVAHQKQKPQLEYHKVLYKVQMVFPDAAVLEGRIHTTSKGSYTLPPGTHEYPWSFKIPFNNACANDRSQMPTMSVSPGGFEVAMPATSHVKRTLPPTLSGFPGEAEVRYYVKCTVERQSIFQQNTRTFMPFNFFPIEPPRPPVTGDEVYARQKHSFSPVDEEPKGKSKLKDIFSAKSKQFTSPVSPEAPHISIDARLPTPSIVTCNGDIPLRLIAKRLNDCEGAVYLQSLQVSLVGSTKIRAHTAFRTEGNSWVIMSKSNMGVQLGNATDPLNTEVVIDDRLWRGQPLPNTVAPSFETCNIIRTYQLDVRIGLSYGGAAHSSSKVRKGQIPKIPQSIVLPLRLDVEVFSGIKPPPELLRAMANPIADITQPVTKAHADANEEKLRMEGRTQSIPPTRTDTAGPSSAPGISARAGRPTGPDEPRYDDAPPSYEDAIATDLPPVDAPRPLYAPPPPAEDDDFQGDEKKGFGRRGS